MSDPDIPLRRRAGQDESSPARALTRRAFLGAVAVSGVAAFLAACDASRPPSPSTVPSVADPSRTAAAATPPPASPSASQSIAPSPSPSPSPGPSLRDRIAGLLVVGFRGERLGDAGWVRKALAEQGVGGVILFDRDQLTGRSRNVSSPDQVRRLVSEIRDAAGRRSTIVAVDQEGGIVTRLSPAHGYPPVASEAAIGERGSAATASWAHGLVATLADAGFNLNFAPVVDLDVNPESPAIGALDRSFSADPSVVVARAKVEIEAHRAAGVRTTLKHFPGIGSSGTNTDFGVADVTGTWTRKELEPFRRLIDASLADLVMAGHVVNRTLDRRRPASLSPAVVTDLLRGELGWDGVVVTDDLQAAAITKTFGRDEAILLALEAGNDLLLFANQQVWDPGIVGHVLDVVESAVASGRLPARRIDEAYERVQATFPLITS